MRQPPRKANCIFRMYPEDVLDMVDLLLVHAGRHKSLMRPPLDPSGARRRPMACSLRRAAILLHFCRVSINEMPCWVLYPGDDTRDRLRKAGIDVDTVQVDNEEKWAICWYLLTKGIRPGFKLQEAEKLYATKFKAPKPSVIEWDMSVPKKQGERTPENPVGANGNTVADFIQRAGWSQQ